jgi:hypothetical protein
MSNHIRKKKSKAMNDARVVGIDGFSYGVGGSYLLKKKYNSSRYMNRINKSGFSLVRTNAGTATSCCSREEYEKKPIVMYSYRNYLYRKSQKMSVKCCSALAVQKKKLEAAKIDYEAKNKLRVPNPLTVEEKSKEIAANLAFLSMNSILNIISNLEAQNKNVYKRLPESGTEIYLENKKGKVLMKEKGECGTTPVEVVEKVECPEKCANPPINDPGYGPDGRVIGQNPIQRSYKQYLDSIKPVYNKPMNFNTASRQINKKKAQRTCGNKNYEAPLANIQMCKHI